MPFPKITDPSQLRVSVSGSQGLQPATEPKRLVKVGKAHKAGGNFLREAFTKSEETAAAKE